MSVLSSEGRKKFAMTYILLEVEYRASQFVIEESRNNGHISEILENT